MKIDVADFGEVEKPLGDYLTISHRQQNVITECFGEFEIQSDFMGLKNRDSMGQGDFFSWHRLFMFVASDFFVLLADQPDHVKTFLDDVLKNLARHFRRPHKKDLNIMIALVFHVSLSS